MNERRAAGFVFVLLALAAGLGLFVSLLSLETTRAVIAWLFSGRLPESLTPERHRRFSQVVMFWSVIGLSLSWIALTRQSVVHAIARRMGLDFRRLAFQLLTSFKRHWFALVSMSLLAAALRIPFLNQPMRYDEAYTYLEYATLPLYQAIALYRDPNNHVMHTLLVHLAIKGFGASAWVCRLPAFLSGCLLIPVTMLLVTKVGRVAKWTAGTSLAACPIAIEYSTNSRGYAIQALAIVCLVLLAISITRASNLAKWSLWSLVAALALWTIPTSIYAVFATFFWMMTSNLLTASRGSGSMIARKHFAFGLVAMAGMTLLLYSPVLIFSGYGAVIGNRYVIALGWPEYSGGLVTALRSDLEFLFRDQPVGIAMLWSAAAILSLFLPERRDLIRLGVFAFCASFSLTVLQRVHPPPRIWFFVIPLGIALGSTSLSLIFDRLRGKRFLQAGGIALIGVMAWTPFYVSMVHHSILASEEGGVFPEAALIVDDLARNQRPHEPVIAGVPAHTPVVFYALQRNLERASFVATATDASSADSVLVVVNLSKPETIAQLLAPLQLPRGWLNSHAQSLAKHAESELVRVLLPKDTTNDHQLDGKAD